MGINLTKKCPLLTFALVDGALLEVNAFGTRGGINRPYR
jgi:hypothetical protein